MNEHEERNLPVFASPSDLSPVIAHLAANGLPVDDVGDHFENFLVLKIGDEVVGTVGLENLGSVGLVRSLCVAESHWWERSSRSAAFRSSSGDWDREGDTAERNSACTGVSSWRTLGDLREVSQ
jgi:hypothetical protein